MVSTPARPLVWSMCGRSMTTRCSRSWSLSDAARTRPRRTCWPGWCTGPTCTPSPPNPAPTTDTATTPVPATAMRRRGRSTVPSGSWPPSAPGRATRDAGWRGSVPPRSPRPRWSTSPPPSVSATGPGLQLVSDTLELRYRLPRLWALVQTGTLAAWKARQVAAQTTHLSRSAALFVDRHLTVLARRGDLPPNRVRPLIHEALLQHDPDTAAGIEEAALTRRGVWFDHRDSTATTTLTGVLDTLDAIDLDHALGDIATQMKTLGDTDHLDTRRAHALGLLAHPQRALNLFTHPTTTTDTASTPRDRRRRRRRPMGRVRTRRLDRHRRRRPEAGAAAAHAPTRPATHAPTRPPVRSGVPAPRSTCTWTSPTSPPPPPPAAPGAAPGQRQQRVQQPAGRALVVVGWRSSAPQACSSSKTG